MTINHRCDAPETFVEDILTLLSERPVLVRDLMQDLRDGTSYVSENFETRRTCRWRNVREQDVLDIVQFLGGYERWRQHGAGVATYVATVPFSTVSYRGKSVPVSE